MWFSVCVCDFVPSDPDPKESRACEALDKVCVCVCSFFSRTLMGRGRVSNEGEKGEDEGGREEGRERAMMQPV